MELCWSTKLCCSRIIDFLIDYQLKRVKSVPTFNNCPLCKIALSPLWFPTRHNCSKNYITEINSITIFKIFVYKFYLVAAWNVELLDLCLSKDLNLFKCSAFFLTLKQIYCTSIDCGVSMNPFSFYSEIQYFYFRRF